MSWPYAYTPYIGPLLTAVGITASLGVYSWRHRSVPGARPFTIFVSLGSLYVLGAALEVSAVGVPAKIFWVKFHEWLMGPTLTTGLWFALEYANLNRWLSRRILIVLYCPWLVNLLLVLTNDAHHWIWVGFSFDGGVRQARGAGYWIVAGYGSLHSIAIPLVFLWLFVRSPLHRRPAALCLCGQIVTRAAYLLDVANIRLFGPMDATPFGATFGVAMYALALFRFRLFDLIPIARGTMVEQMREGMLILDAQQRIVDLNPTAQRILGVPKARARGRTVAELFPAYRAEAPELVLGGEDARHYAVQDSMLTDRHGHPLGRLVLLHDITEQKRAQAQLLEQQWALATFQERERMARELHDSLVQVLGYVKMQAQAARGLLARDQTADVDTYLAQLVSVAQDAHADAREYLLGAGPGISVGAAFLPALEQYLRRFTENYGIATKLNVPPELAGRTFEPMVEAQLLRIIQEALTNVRKHARARAVDIRFGVSDSFAETIIQDDGAGFRAAALETDEGQTFGLRFMRERAEAVGGAVRVQSAPGDGTRVVIRVPLRKEPS